MRAVPPPGPLDPAGHDVIDVALEVAHVHFEGGLLVFAEETELANVDILEGLAGEDVLELPLLVVSEGFGGADEWDFGVLLVLEVVGLLEFLEGALQLGSQVQF